jgi:hypothetical protein
MDVLASLRTVILGQPLLDILRGLLRGLLKGLLRVLTSRISDTLVLDLKVCLPHIIA